MKIQNRVVALISLFGSGSLFAVPVMEEYTYTGAYYSGMPYESGISEGQTGTFAFDLHNRGAGDTNVGGMELTSDGFGAFGVWTSGSFEIDLWAEDSALETATLSLSAYDGDSHLFEIDSWSWDGQTGTQSFDFALTGEQLNILSVLGSGLFSITADFDGDDENRNDFAITRAALSIDVSDAGEAVPEPGALAFLILGLIGLRARQHKV
ncbi:MAG: hypothetical protein MI808_12645 [Pseudomonadales bacterium]|nr:hypothetical protein [Pseudomonadales bacterium]